MINSGVSEKTKSNPRRRQHQTSSELLAASSARLQSASAAQTQAWLEWLATHAQYAVTLQTRIDSDGLTDAQLDRKRQQIVKELNWLLPRINQRLTGNGWQRKAKYMPLFAATIQTGLIRGEAHSMQGERKTMHVHALLGNVQDKFSPEDIQTIFRDLWTRTSIGVDDIDVRPLVKGSEAGWGRYMARDLACYTHRNTADFTTFQVPPQIAALTQSLRF